MRNSGLIWIIIAVMIVLDIYVFQALRTVTQHASIKLKIGIYSIYWLVSIASVVLLIALPHINFDGWSRSLRSTVFAILIGLFFAKMIASLFFFIDDVRRGLTWITALFTRDITLQAGTARPEGISRSVFMSWLGIAAGGGLFGTLIYGFGNKYKYQLKKARLSFSNLPASFKGLKIVQISDIHSGSFANKEAVKKGVAKIMQQKPDLILFTGDLINDRSSEMNNYIEVFNVLKAPLGVYAVLGNHDYGDYVQWDSEEAKKRNLQDLEDIIKQMGWKLLMNEHVALERGGDRIALLGVENWSAKGRFPKYGKMSEAYPGAEKYPFKILLSHDPSHWDAEVRPLYPDIDLMLSGHTHGMQFGLEVPGFKWSPVQYMYKQWAGLYEEGKQKLYVNRGYGFIGYPGRVGILPEITVIELT